MISILDSGQVDRVKPGSSRETWTFLSSGAMRPSLPLVLHFSFLSSHLRSGFAASLPEKLQIFQEENKAVYNEEARPVSEFIDRVPTWFSLILTGLRPAEISVAMEGEREREVTCWQLLPYWPSLSSLHSSSMRAPSSLMAPPGMKGLPLPVFSPSCSVLGSLSFSSRMKHLTERRVFPSPCTNIFPVTSLRKLN